MSDTQQPRGVVVPMISPLTDALEVDQAATAGMVRHLIAGGVHGILVLGTNGESMSLDSASKRTLVEIAVRTAQRQTLIYAGVSGNCLGESIAAASEYGEMGVFAVAAHPPFYFPTDDAALIDWFTAIADQSPVPLVLYNIPLTTGVSMGLQVVRQAGAHPNIIGIKETDREAGRLEAILEMDFETPFAVLAGRGATYGPDLLNGAVGFVPSSGNLNPRLHVDLFEAAQRGESGEVEKLAEAVWTLGQTYQSQRTLSEAIAQLKALAAEMGLCRPNVLPPLRMAHKESPA